jgi:hypothetical protein
MQLMHTAIQCDFLIIAIGTVNAYKFRSDIQNS